MRKNQVQFTIGVMMLLLGVVGLFGQTSNWATLGSDGRLHYKTDANGNRIIDFSSAGYGGGGVSLPNVPVRVTLNPSGGDDTAAIQSAINAVSAMPIGSDGFRGAVQLAAGTFSVSSTLHISASGVVLHGNGSGPGGTVINMTGDPFLFLSIAGSGSTQNVGSSVPIIDPYVPSGASSLTVSNASNFHAGDTVLVRRPVTSGWIHFMGMDTLVRDGQPQTWISAGSTITTDRVITAVSGNVITVDVPLTDSFDSQFVSPPGASIVKYNFPGRISQVAAEGFSVIAVPKNVDITQPQYEGLSVSAVLNAWVRDVTFQDTQNTITVSTNVKQMTFDNVIVNHTAPHSGDGPADFALSGTQLLANKCSVLGLGSNVWAAVTQSRVTGPVALLNFHSDDRGFDPHQRWATGLLCDNCSFPNSHTSDKAGVAYSNRGILGSGQGWDAGWSVAWNVNSKFFTIQQPPGSQNFCVGCVGTVLTQAQPGTSSPLLPNGIYDSFGTPVTPSSLYLQQLLERKGPQAVINIGYLDYLKSIDSVAPVTTASISPSPNGNGWNNSDVTVTLSSTDNESTGGTGAQQISFSASGAQSVGATVVSGGSTSFTINKEGITTVTFFGTDFAGNVETAKTVSIKVDKTPPAISALRTPASNGNGWNNSDVSVAFQCADAVSGLAADSPPAPIVLSAEGANQSASGACTDLAGNTASATIGGINIDKTPPSMVCGAVPNHLWPPNHKLVPVNISVTVSDALSGPNGFTLTSAINSEPDSGLGDMQGFVVGSAPISGLLRAGRLGSGAGRVYAFTYNGTDRAGNSASCTTNVSVPHDQGQ
jgi:hypothetical protein